MTDLFPKAGGTVSGLRVRDTVPDRGSIRASMNNYVIVPHICEVPFSVFDIPARPQYYSKTEKERTLRLASAIAESGEINPLIVVIDGTGPYILEGGHRFDALQELGIKTFPALVVIDED